MENNYRLIWSIHCFRVLLFLSARYPCSLWEVLKEKKAGWELSCSITHFMLWNVLGTARMDNNQLLHNYKIINKCRVWVSHTVHDHNIETCLKSSTMLSWIGIIPPLKKIWGIRVHLGSYKMLKMTSQYTHHFTERGTSIKVTWNDKCTKMWKITSLVEQF